MVDLDFVSVHRLRGTDHAMCEHMLRTSVTTAARYKNIMELLSRLELPNLFITNEVLYRLSYSSTPIFIMVLYFAACVNRIAALFGKKIEGSRAYGHRCFTIFFFALWTALSTDFTLRPSFIATL